MVGNLVFFKYQQEILEIKVQSYDIGPITVSLQMIILQILITLSTIFPTFVLQKILQARFIIVTLPLRSQKAGRSKKLLDFSRGHSIVSRAPPIHTLPAFLNLKQE